MSAAKRPHVRATAFKTWNEIARPATASAPGKIKFPIDWALGPSNAMRATGKMMPAIDGTNSASDSNVAKIPNGSLISR